ncbi:hypothetical protein K1T71_010154 [Dendrolimus kikuchii]|uniref:Uncharacterized protein n=1 Tax=Dendrolimus kikuchii TaxID=765133 RepID=A0ACC1CQU9_9NEOP|nr:hypothetical protein K1T71_010154 [Dendrolimus kikuchii]
MKFFVAIALIATMASAAVIGPTLVSEEIAQIQEVIAAIQSPSTDPATAAALEAMLQDIFGLNPEPVIVGPAVVDIDSSPISVGPALVDFPLPDGGAVTAPEAVVAPPVIEPSPVVIGELEAGQPSPLVQVIINVNSASGSPAPAPSPADSAIVDEAADPIHVVDQVAEPVIVVESPTVLEPVQVAEPVIVEPVIVGTPVVVEPVVIGTPIIPAPAVVLPEELN